MLNLLMRQAYIQSEKRVLELLVHLNLNRLGSVVTSANLSSEYDLGLIDP